MKYSLRLSLLCLLVGSVAMPTWCKPKVKAKRDQVKVTEMLAEVNDLMSQASASYIDGKANEAIETYRLALSELARLELENPARADTAAFAPVRFRRALCETEIDRIQLEEVNATARTVTVSDTAELEAKRAARKKEAQEANLPDAVVALETKKGGTQAGGEGAAEGTLAADKMAEELEWAKDMLSIDSLDEARKTLISVLRHAPDNLDGRLLLAQVQLQQNQATDALVVLDDILQDYPHDLGALLLAAGAYMTNGNALRAMEKLDQALQVAPQQPAAYYNMAWLLLEMKPENLDEPEMYYRQAIKLGGARDRHLERRLGIKNE